MFFIVSKLVYYLILPFTWIILLFVASLIIKNSRWKKRSFVAALVMLLFFSNDFIANQVMNAWEVEGKPFADLKKHKLGIVLTGATSGGINPDDRVYFNKGADRVVHTVQLYKLKLIDKILVSGGSGKLMGESEPEANKFRKAMVLMGVPPDSIIIENETRNTAESALEVKKLLAKLNYKADDCVLITSAFHMRRSLASFRKAGLELDPFSTDFYALDEFKIEWLFIPRIEAVIKWHKLFKEWVGFIGYRVAGYI